MSKLDNALDIGGAKPYDSIKADIKALFLELVGENEKPSVHFGKANALSNSQRAKNEEKARLRQAIKDL